jgi:hypothetical protein
VPWDKAPKVQTAIKSLMSYNSGYSGNDQYYECYADVPTKDGFYVYGHSIIPGTSNQFDSGNREFWSGNRTHTTTMTTNYSRTDVTKIKLNGLKLEEALAGYMSIDEYNVDVYYKEINDSRIHYKNWHGTDAKDTVIQTDITLSDLPAGEYRFEIEFEITISDYEDGDGNVNGGYDSATDWKDVVVDNGDVMWIAVEGGAD